MAAHGWASRPGIFKFGRSKAIEDFCDVDFVFHHSAIVSSVMSALSFIQTKGLVQFSLTFSAFELQNLTLNIICLVAAFKGLSAHLFLFVYYRRSFLYKATRSMH